MIRASSPEEALSSALDADLEDVVIVGTDAHGERVILATVTGRAAERLLTDALDEVA